MEKLPPSYPKSEDQERVEFLERGSFIEINQLLAYGLREDTLQLHVLPNKETSIGEKLKLLREGMEKLAEIVRDEETIKEVTIRGWIVLKRPSLLEKLGFKIELEWNFFGKIVNDFAHISREDLINKYLDGQI